MFSLLTLGFLIGMRHALEADHLAAVATLATRTPTVAGAVRQGVAWGVGHTVTLFTFGSLVLLLDAAVPETVAHALELLVGVMLVLLGADVLRRLWRERVHFHVHSHTSGATHFHAHSHRGEKTHDARRHRHRHGLPLRALAIGLVHGMAGSAALILLTLGTVGSTADGLAYMAVFGLGSLAGMAALSVVIPIPLRYWPAGLTWVHNGLQAVLGIATLGLGVVIVLDSAAPWLVAV